MGNSAKEVAFITTPKCIRYEGLAKRKDFGSLFVERYLYNTLINGTENTFIGPHDHKKKPRLQVSSHDFVNVDELLQPHQHSIASKALDDSGVSCTDTSSNASSTDSDFNDSGYCMSSMSSRSSSRAPDPENPRSKHLAVSAVSSKLPILLSSEQHEDLSDLTGGWAVEIQPLCQALAIDSQMGILFEGDLSTNLEISGNSKTNTDFIVDEHSESSSVTTLDGNSPSGRNMQPGTTAVDPNESSSNSDSSSQSLESRAHNDEDEEGTIEKETLEHFIKKVALITDPNLADFIFHELDGQVEYIPPSHLEQIEDATHLTLLEHFMLQRPISGPFTTYAPSSTSSENVSSGSSSSGIGGESSSSSNSRGVGQQNKPSGKDKSTQQGPGQPVNMQKKSNKSNYAKPTNILLLRCIYNALMPEIFCVNNETREKYRPCAGPGYKSIQHLKEHLSTHHTTKANPFQCNQCQEEFGSSSLLQSHELEVDCPIRCPDCEATFSRKAQRQTHQEQHHQKTRSSQFFDIDLATEKQIKEELKAYTESLKKSKSPSDPGLQQWVEKNLVRFMHGRSVSVYKARLELGQWYTIYRIIAPGREVSDHPFYDYTAPDPEMVVETILLIHGKIVRGRISNNGPPPLDLEASLNWHGDALRDSLTIAARTRIIPRGRDSNPSVSVNTPIPQSVLPTSNTSEFSTIHDVDYGIASQPQASVGQQAQLPLQPEAGQFYHNAMEGPAFTGWAPFPQDEPYNVQYRPEFFNNEAAGDILGNPSYPPQGWPGQ
ncbi:hypothetical protein PVAG01_06190 [Phlyctema vagabunda]|uniref:C2H2-type domain-containing protein n=1 Tax=Phlyctema vagabunda TaxID=108571 RepID=A0ABR4PFD7_9HELO